MSKLYANVQPLDLNEWLKNHKSKSVIPGTIYIPLEFLVDIKSSNDGWVIDALADNTAITWYLYE